MVFNVCVKFHENMSSGFKVMERTRKLLTDTHTHTHTHTERKDENIIPPWHTSYAGGIIKALGLAVSEEMSFEAIVDDARRTTHD